MAVIDREKLIEVLKTLSDCPADWETRGVDQAVDQAKLLIIDLEYGEQVSAARHVVGG